MTLRADAADAAAARSGSAPQRGLIAVVKAYRLLLSPWLGSGCRFHPTCSAYALQALADHGAASGSYLTLRRIVRCHPLCPGGVDPVPPIARTNAAETDRGAASCAVTEKTFS